MRSRRRSSPPVRVTRSLPHGGVAAALDRLASLPRSEPLRALRARLTRRFSVRGALLRLEPARAVLVEELGDGLLHTQRELLVGLTLLGKQGLAEARTRMGGRPGFGQKRPFG